ncbi:MAG: hypothetical protein IT462_16175 [Planctomycetes bacterium]|nr:hypothetical protein [Planctomycetota bacterium]
MLTKLATTLMLMCLAAPLMAEDSSQPKNSIRTVKYPVMVDGTCQLKPSIMLDKDDQRENLGMFGIRPAFVFILPDYAVTAQGKLNTQAYAEMFSFIDQLGQRLGKKADVVALYYLGRDGDPTKPPAHIAQFKSRNASLMALKLSPTGNPSDSLIDVLWNMDVNSALGAMNWMYMAQLGEITDSGMGSKDPKLEDNVKRVEKRLPIKGDSAAIMDKLARWNVGETLKLIAKAEAKAKDDQLATLKLQRETAEKMEEIYRGLVVSPEQERRYFVEYADALANLSKILKGSERAAEVSAELAEFKKTDEFKVAQKAQPKFAELRKEYYSIHVYVKRGESEREYYARKAKAMNGIKLKLQAFAQDFAEIGYADVALGWVAQILYYEALGNGSEN